MRISEAIALMQAILDAEGDHDMVVEVGDNYHDVNGIESNPEAGWLYILVEK